MIRMHLLHIIGTCPASPRWLKMWCLRKTMVGIQRMIEKLPPQKRAHFDRINVKHGMFRG